MKRNIKDISLEEIVGRFSILLGRARGTPDWDEGISAYASYNMTMFHLGQFYGVDTKTACGVFAALSPNADYHGNLRSCATVLLALRDGWELEEVTVTTYKQNLFKAWRIGRGEEFSEVFQGLKVNEFYKSILNPSDRENFCVDGHMANIARGQKLVLTNAGLTESSFKKIKEAGLITARIFGISGPACQAILWFRWKMENRIKFNPQMTFDIGNQWQNIQTPYKIITYKRKITQ